MTLEEAKKELQGVIVVNEQLADDDLFNTLIEALDDLMWYRKQNLIQLDDAINATKGIFHCGSYVSDIIKDLPLVEQLKSLESNCFVGIGKIYKDNVLVAEPCRRKADNAIGFYNYETKKFIEIDNKNEY